jgi:putative SOS response-associated peptidase YedK
MQVSGRVASENPVLGSKGTGERGSEFCTVLMCALNNAMAEIHNRMPVILGENDWPK